jgi:O-antigen biosynthesis protein WbqP
MNRTTHEIENGLWPAFKKALRMRVPTYDLQASEHAADRVLQQSGKAQVEWQKRVFDIGLSLILMALLSSLFLVVALLIKATSRGAVLHWSRRVGKNNKLFWMPKFRSMQIETPQVATHLLADPSAYLTPIGSFMRRTSLDELPQLFSILVGDLSFVGPRPALFNQDDLVALRAERGIDKLLPGLTGWAQVNGRDELPICSKVNLDLEYLQRHSFKFDLKILFMTLVKVLRSEGVSH